MMKIRITDKKYVDISFILEIKIWTHCRAKVKTEMYNPPIFLHIKWISDIKSEAENQFKMAIGN